MRTGALKYLSDLFETIYRDALGTKVMSGPSFKGSELLSGLVRAALAGIDDGNRGLDINKG